MHYYLHSMSAEDMDYFRINDESCRAKLFDEMKADFETDGPVEKQRVLEAIEHIMSSEKIDQLWAHVSVEAIAEVRS
jgi:hypothetical protein